MALIGPLPNVGDGPLDPELRPCSACSALECGCTEADVREAHILMQENRADWLNEKD